MAGKVLFRLIAIVCASVCACVPAYADRGSFLSDRTIAYINSLNTTWVAGHNFDPTKNTIEDLRRLFGLLPLAADDPIRARLRHPNPPKLGLIELPAKFDAREHWPHCASVIGDIRDQGACGSCWAVSAASVISDRICIVSNGTIRVSISSEDALSCTPNMHGCSGGHSGSAFEHYCSAGLVTGGHYRSNSGCRPYSIAGCEHHVTGPLPSCSTEHAQTPRCVSKCANEGYAKSYRTDLFRGARAYYVPTRRNAERAMMEEIYTNGPIGVGFMVYDDFLLYRSGIYQHVVPQLPAKSGHAVKLIGWGEEHGIKYWLAANSWNENWGEKGYFKVLRGVDFCRMESMEVVAVTPRI